MIILLLVLVGLTQVNTLQRVQGDDVDCATVVLHLPRVCEVQRQYTAGSFWVIFQ